MNTASSATSGTACGPIWWGSGISFAKAEAEVTSLLLAMMESLVQLESNVDVNVKVVED